MAFNINHIHLKAPDPKKTADWYVKAFNFEIVSDIVRLMAVHWICQICGESSRGEHPPEACPKCGAVADRFRQEPQHPGM